MSEIRKGDLVIIRRNCCNQDTVGTVAEVKDRKPAKGLLCRRCWQLFSVSADIVYLEVGDRWGWIPIAWVTKLEPLPESERQPTQEGVPA